MSTAPTRVVLSHPFSGALYAFFAEQAGHAPPPQNTHPYYRTLFGDRYREVETLTLTLAVLFDELVMAPADTHLPDFKKYDGDTYHNPELGITSSWHDFMSVRDADDVKVSKLLQDEVIGGILRKVPPNGQRQILLDALYERHLAAKNGCPIVCAGGRRGILNRVAELEAQEAGLYSSGSLEAAATYVDITGLMFEPKTIDALYGLKGDKELR